MLVIKMEEQNFVYFPTQNLIMPFLVWNNLFHFVFLSTVNKSYWLLDSNYGTTSITTDLLQPSTIANVTGELVTFQDNKLSSVNRNIHTEDDHTSPMTTIRFILLGSLSSLCIIGCIIFIRSR